MLFPKNANLNVAKHISSMVNTYCSMYVSLGEYTNEPNEVFMFEEDTSKLKCSNVQYQHEN